jgi:head-tail adaptor
MARLHWIEIEQATVDTDAAGDDIEAWAPYISQLAEGRRGAGQERREAALETAVETATFVIPWSPLTAAIKAKDRVQFQGTWDVTNVSESLAFRKWVEVTGTKRTT